MIASMEDVLGVSTKVLLVGSSTIASMEDVLWLSNEHRKCSGQVSTGSTEVLVARLEEL